MAEMTAIMQKDRQYIAGTYKRFPLEIVSGQGSLVRDAAGNDYIDMGSGIAVTSFGIADEAWTEAVTKQLHTLQHMSNLYYTDPCVRVAELLCQKTGMSKVFFSNSGAEANECAIKAARKYSAEKHGEDCFTVVTLRNSFHGRTLTTLAATGQEHYHELFRPLTPGFAHVTADRPEELEALAKEVRIAAVMIECIQGEGGVVPLSPAYARFVQAFTQERDIPLIVDEVQTGNGRTGALYAYMRYGLQPDIVSTAKGIAGGLPMGATLLSEKLKDVFGFGDHGSTFGGNPVCAAGAYSVLTRLTDSFLDQVREKGDWLADTLSAAPGISEVTGMGLMLGLKTERPAADVVADCMKNGVLCLTAKDKVRLLPALNIPMPLLEAAAQVIAKAAAVK